MSDAPNDNPIDRWATINREVQELRYALSGFTLMGVLDRDTNHIATMQEEIDRKAREVLVAYWLGSSQGELPAGIA